MPTPLKGLSSNPNRVVAVLTPLVFAPLAGTIAAGVAKYGVNVDDGQLQAIFIAGATIALAKSAQWTKGWQAYEQREAIAAAAADTAAIGDEEDLGAEAEREFDVAPHELGFDEGVPETPHDLVFDDGVLDRPRDVALDDGAEDLHGVEDDLDADMDDDFEAEAAELLAGHGS